MKVLHFFDIKNELLIEKDEQRIETINKIKPYFNQANDNFSAKN